MKLFSLIDSGNIHLADRQKKVIPAEQAALLLDAQEVVDKAHQDAETLHEKGLKQAKEAKEKAKQKGFEEGLATFNEHVLSLDQSIKKLRLEMQQQVLPLALKAAKKIVGEAFKADPQLIVDVVMQTLKPVVHSSEIRIIVSKEDWQKVEDNKAELKKMMEQIESFTIEEREDITPGGCIIETESGIINATIENQWRALEAAFEKFTNQ